jgi:hypothetical protein
MRIPGRFLQEIHMFASQTILDDTVHRLALRNNPPSPGI